MLAALASGPLLAAPTVNGNVISWTEEGWYQVQNQTTFESLCQGGRQCTVPGGVYIVINHTTGERFANIPVVDPAGDSVPAPLPATGQTSSYGFGDDGDYQSGVAVAGERFPGNNDGTFTDTLTGLVWLSIQDCFALADWSGALERANTFAANSETCTELDDGSVAGDWRLPNLRELYSLVDITADTALLSHIPLTGNGGARFFENYWTSSSFRPVPETTAWTIEPNFGRQVVTEKDVQALVWPVRDSR